MLSQIVMFSHTIEIFYSVTMRTLMLRFVVNQCLSSISLNILAKELIDAWWLCRRRVLKKCMFISIVDSFVYITWYDVYYNFQSIKGPYMLKGFKSTCHCNIMLFFQVMNPSQVYLFYATMFFLKLKHLYIFSMLKKELNYDCFWTTINFSFVSKPIRFI